MILIAVVAWTFFSGRSDFVENRGSSHLRNNLLLFTSRQERYLDSFLGDHFDQKMWMKKKRIHNFKRSLQIKMRTNSSAEKTMGNQNALHTLSILCWWCFFHLCGGMTLSLRGRHDTILMWCVGGFFGNNKSAINCNIQSHKFSSYFYWFNGI